MLFLYYQCTSPTAAHVLMTADFSHLVHNLEDDLRLDDDLPLRILQLEVVALDEAVYRVRAV